jgi:prophage regulatory protein
MSADYVVKGPRSAGAGALMPGCRVPRNRALRLPQVEDRTGLKETAIREMVKLGQFPPPFKVGASAVAWLESDIDDWLIARSQRRLMFAISPIKTGD